MRQLSCSLLLFFSAANAVAGLEDLNQVLIKARAHTPAAKLAAGRLQEAQAKMDEADAAYLPKFKGEAAIAPVPGVSFDEPTLTYVRHYDDWGVFTYLKGEIRQAITTFGRISEYQEAARIGVAGAKWAEVVALSELDLQVRRFYFTYMMSSQNLSMVSSHTKSLAEEIEKRKNAKDKSVRDQLRQLETLHVLLSGAEAKLRAAKFTAVYALALMTGETEEGINKLDDDFEAEPMLSPTFTSLKDALLTSNPEIQIATAMAQAQDHLANAKFLEFMPVLGIVGVGELRYAPNRDSASNPYLEDSTNRDLIGIAAAVSWDFDFFKIKAQESEARGKAITQDAERQVLVMKKTIELRSTYEEWASLKSLVQLTESEYRRAKRESVVRKMGSSLGTATTKDFLEAVKRQFEARKQWSEAVLSWNAKGAELARLTGAKTIYPSQYLKNL
jgi:outer membrane protein TolC